MSISVIRLADFTSSEGVNTHINYNDGAYANVGDIISDLQYLGVNRVRDGLNTPGQFGGPTIAAYETVARAGIKFTLFVGGGGSFTTTGGVPTDPSLDQRIGYIDQLVQAVPGSVLAVEGTNEINNQPIVYNGLGSSHVGADELNATLSMQRDLYAMVHADPNLVGVPVDYFTGYGAGTIPIGPDPATTPGLADFDTQHPYPNGGQAPAFWVSRSQVLSNETAVDAANAAPVVFTETGYSSLGGTGGAVNQDVQAKYTLDLFLNDAKNGVTTTYLYELLDAYSPGSRQGDAGYGLFDYLGNAKPVAVDIHNMNIILNDTGSNATSFTPTTLTYTVNGESSTGNDLELAKSDGSHVIALWDEQSIWNTATGTELSPVHHIESVFLGDGTTLYNVAEYDPTVGTSPISQASGVSSVNVDVSDHPVFLLITPSSSVGTKNGEIAPVNDGTPTQAASATLDPGQTPTNSTSATDTTALAGPVLLTVVEGQSLTDLATTLITATNIDDGVTPLFISAVSTTGTDGFVTFDAGTDMLSYTARGYQPGGTADSFSYVVSDGTTNWTVSAQIEVTSSSTAAALQTVTAGQDATTFEASGSDQRLILSNATTCSLTDGQGNDLVFAGSGADTITLSGWNNTVYGGPGGDAINAGYGNETVVARDGMNWITCGGYDNVISAGNGNDVVLGPEGNSTITLGTGNNTVVVFGYDNVITVGDNGSAAGLVGALSYINAGAGDATVTAGNGTNIVLAGGFGDTITVGNGTNLVFATALTGALTSPSGLPSGNGATEPSQGNCTVTLGTGNNWVYLNGWSNTVNDGSGVDAVWGGLGNDSFVLNAAGGGLFVENFSLANGDKLDLSQILGGTSLNSDLTNISSFMTVVGHGTDDAAFGIPSDGGINTELEVTGLHGTALVNLENTGAIGLSDLVAHGSLVFHS